MTNQDQNLKKQLPKTGPLTTPLSLRGWPRWAIYLFSLIGLVYIINPGAGFLEFLPDNLPIIGNLDEGVAMMLLWMGLVEFFEGRKAQQSVVDGEIIEPDPYYPPPSPPERDALPEPDVDDIIR
jgi:hypothetical protein